MNNRNTIIAIAIVLVTVLLMGEALAYAFNPYSHNSDVEIDDSGISYTIETPGSWEYDIIILDNGDVPKLNELIMLSTGGIYFERIETELAIRGFYDVRMMDPSEIGEMTDHPLGKAILIPYGPIPEELYSGETTDFLVRWLEEGGTVYWFGCVPDGGYDYDLSLLGLSEDDFWSDESSEDYKASASPFCKSLKLRNHFMGYGLNADIGTPLAFVSESGFSSITSMKVLNGTMVIFAGGHSYENSMDCAQIITSGITHDTIIVEHQEGTISNCKDGRILYPDESGISSIDNISVYIYIGGYYIVYGERHE